MILMNIKENLKKNKLIYYIIWTLFGIIISFIVCSIILSGNSTIHTFYDVGEVYEIRNDSFRTFIEQEGGHQEKTGKVVLDNGYFKYGISIVGNKNCWNYLCVQLRETDGIQWTVNYSKQQNGEIVESEEYDCTLHSGMNLLDVPKNSFDNIFITATGNSGESFYLTSIQLRENKPVWSAKKACLFFVFSFLMYIIFSISLIFVCYKMRIKINPYRLTGVLQSIYMAFARQLQKIISYDSPNVTYIRYSRRTIFVMMFLYSIWVETQDTYFADFAYHILIYLIFILIIIVLSMRTDLTRKKWNNSLVCSWLILWIMSCISDFLLPKDFRFIGCIMIFGIGFFIFIWNNIQNPDELIKDFVCAIHIFFMLVLIFCVLCRPEIDGRRYSGISKNPGVFGLYLGTIWAVILSEIETRIYGGHRLKQLLPYILELCLVFSFCWKSQSTSSLLCMFGLGLICFLKIVCSVSKKKKKILFTVILCAVVLLFPTYKSLSWGLKYIPQFTGISIIFEKEEPIAKIEYGPVVYAKDFGKELKDSRIVQKLTSSSVSQVFSGRDYYYRAYLRNMNLFGHNENPELWGASRLPHNAILAIAYRYGIFTSIPYILMLAAVILRTFRYSLRKSEYTSIPFFVCLSSIVMSMVDNVELPFFWLPWFGLYLLMGIAFDDDIVYGTGKKNNEEENIIL